MRHTLLALTLAVAATGASATGFAPWNDRDVNLEQSFDAPADITVMPFYGIDRPSGISETPDQQQRRIDITPFYKLYA
jgi:hypothetical protein